ncbi:metallopeptidase family protein [Candidatus Roizmanbacteria bacterium]|nr:metallopeptidase family protein [Candidatus Roizmanbacteria bacterium]
MTDEQFSTYIDRAVASLPKEFRDKMENVAIVIEDYPSDEHLASVRMRRGRRLLLGLYQGIPRTKRGAMYGVGGTLPDKITIFKYSVLQIVQTEEELIAQVRSTVLHEIAHHFGMSEEEIKKAQSDR